MCFTDSSSKYQYIKYNLLKAKKTISATLHYSWMHKWCTVTHAGTSIINAHAAHFHDTHSLSVFFGIFRGTFLKASPWQSTVVPVQEQWGGQAPEWPARSRVLNKPQIHKPELGTISSAFRLPVQTSISKPKPKDTALNLYCSWKCPNINYKKSISS